MSHQPHSVLPDDGQSESSATGASDAGTVPALVDSGSSADTQPEAGAARPDVDTGTRRGRAELRRRASNRQAVMVLWLVAAGVLLVDQLTKLWAVAALSDGHRVQVLGDLLALVLVRNPGAAFSLATGQTWIFTVVAVVVTVIVVRVSKRLAVMPWAVVLGMVLGGAVGNLIDRLLRSPGVLRGHVVDFISYNGFFVGNVADIAIVLAALGIVVLSLIGLELDGTRPNDETQEGKDAATSVLSRAESSQEAGVQAPSSGSSESSAPSDETLA